MGKWKLLFVNGFECITVLEDCVEKEYCCDDFSFDFYNLGNTAHFTVHL